MTLACASAVENSDVAGRGDSVTSGVSNNRLSIARFDGHYDVTSHTLNFSPATTAGSSGAALLLSSPSTISALSEVLSPTLNSGWGTRIYDVASQRIYISNGAYENGDGRGGCISVSAAKNAHNVRAEFSLFNPTSTVAGQGAVSTGNLFAVDYGDVPANVSACRPFSITNVSGTSFRFSLQFTATALDDKDPEAYIAYAKRTNLVNDPSDDAELDFVGAGWSKDTDHTKDLTLIDDGVSPYDLYPNYYSDNFRVSKKDPYDPYFRIHGYASSLPAAGFFKGNVEGGYVYGPYITQYSGIRANLKTSGAAIPGSLLWLVRNASSCVALQEETHGCGNGGLDRETNSTTYTFSTSNVTSAMNYLSTSVSGAHCVYVVLDTNSNGQIDTNDVYAMIPGVTITPGRIADLGAVDITANSIEEICTPPF